MYKSCKLGMMPQKATKPKNCKKNMFKKKSARFTGSPKKALGFPKNVRLNMCTLYSARKVVQEGVFSLSSFSGLCWGLGFMGRWFNFNQQT